MVKTFYPPYSFGSDGNVVRNLPHELPGRGHPVDILHFRGFYQVMGRSGPAELQVKPSNITVHGPESRWGALSPIPNHQTGLPLFKTRLIQNVLTKPFDVIDYHNVSVAGGPKAPRYGKAINHYTWREYWLDCRPHPLKRNGPEPCTEPRRTSHSPLPGRAPQEWRDTNLLPESLASIHAFFSTSRFAIAPYRKLQLQMPVIHFNLRSSPRSGPRCRPDRFLFPLSGKHGIR